MGIGNRYNFLGLIRFALPTICMMIVYSIYTVIDGIFIGRFVGGNALAATNIVYPMINLALGVTIMFASGGSAVVAKTLGEQQPQLARQRFTLLVTAACLLVGCLAAIALLFLPFWIRLLGATELLYDDCYVYAWWMMLFSPFMTAGMLFNYFFIVAGKPNYSFYNSLAGGFTNILFDYLLICVWGMGVEGAALATAFGYVVSAAFGVYYFAYASSILHFSRFVIDVRLIARAAYNGLSEMVSQISTGITTYAFNYFLLLYAGETGVAAITIILYVEFLIVAIFIGFSSGVSPVISYWYGANDASELRTVIKNCYKFILVVSGIAYILAQGLAEPMARLFTDDMQVREMTINGFRLFAVDFLFSGICLLTSGVFTALSDGRSSALVSLARNLIGNIICMVVLANFLQLTGIWLAVPMSSFLTMFLAIYLCKTELKKYSI